MELTKEQKQITTFALGAALENNEFYIIPARDKRTGEIYSMICLGHRGISSEEVKAMVPIALLLSKNDASNYEFLVGDSVYETSTVEEIEKAKEEKKE